MLHYCCHPSFCTETHHPLAAKYGYRKCRSCTWLTQSRAFYRLKSCRNLDQVRPYLWLRHPRYRSQSSSGQRYWRCGRLGTYRKRLAQYSLSWRVASMGTIADTLLCRTALACFPQSHLGPTYPLHIGTCFYLIGCGAGMGSRQPPHPESRTCRFLRESCSLLSFAFNYYKWK